HLRLAVAVKVRYRREPIADGRVAPQLSPVALVDGVAGDQLELIVFVDVSEEAEGGVRACAAAPVGADPLAHDLAAADVPQRAPVRDLHAAVPIHVAQGQPSTPTEGVVSGVGAVRRQIAERLDVAVAVEPGDVAVAGHADDVDALVTIHVAQGDAGAREAERPWFGLI